MKAKEVAKHIINYCIGIDNPISNLQLNKMLYFLDIYYLINKHKRLIADENFVAWKYGPVIESIYKKYSMYASNTIKKWEDFEEDFDDDFKGSLYGFIDKLSKYSPFELVERSFEKDSPCERTKRDEIIPLEYLEEYANQFRVKGKQ